MDALIKPIEMALAPLFKNLPALPENGKKAIVRFWPWVALIAGVLQLFAVYSLWQLGHAVSWTTDYANQLSIAAGYGPVTPTLGFFYYLGLASLLLDAVILLLAFAPLKAHKKSGWNLLFLGSLVNLVYGVLIAFDGRYGSMSNLIGALIGSVIAFYFLYQIRDYYTGVKSAETVSKPATKTTPASSSDTTSSDKTKEQ